MTVRRKAYRQPLPHAHVLLGPAGPRTGRGGGRGRTFVDIVPFLKTILYVFYLPMQAGIVQAGPADVSFCGAVRIDRQSTAVAAPSRDSRPYRGGRDAGRVPGRRASLVHVARAKRR